MAAYLSSVRNEIRVASASRHHISAQRLVIGKRRFHSSPAVQVVKSFLLADIGEGITECQLIQWFVQPGARVEQFDKICEVQSDKASVEITTPYDGIIKKLHYETDEMALTGKPLIDIDVQEDDVEETALTNGASDASEEQAPSHRPDSSPRADVVEKSYQAGLATPAVRHLMKQLNVSIADIRGTGRDGRVTKDDVQQHVRQHDRAVKSASNDVVDETREVSLSPVQRQMFTVMTRSLSIPHFLYSSSTDMTRISEMRKKLNADANTKITPLAVILKAVSLAFKHHEIMNAALNITNEDKPHLTYHAAHHFGIAVDTPTGLVVPVIRSVNTMSITDIAVAISDISQRARLGRLAPADFKGATFTLSNIGSIGGGVVSPVISEPQVAILGIGRSRLVPAFNAAGELWKKEELIMSWSADHRVVDGAECARCAERVRAYLEEPETMLKELR